MRSKKQKWTLFGFVNSTLLIILALVCLLPMLYIVAVSFSSRPGLIDAGFIIWPKDFTTAAYDYCLKTSAFLKSLWVSCKRILLGVPLNMIVTVLAAYPLSKSNSEFKGRTVYAWIFVFTMLCSGGMIPTYMIVYKLGLMGSIWSLILPGAVPVFNLVLMINFFRNVPKSLEEAAIIDGASQWRCLWSVYLPLSKAALATLMLFCLITHWNSWMDGIIYMDTSDKYPLQSYLQTLVIKMDFTSIASNQKIPNFNLLSDKNLKCAQIVLGALPLVCAYPFIQKYFTQGVTLGSVKG